MENIYSYLKKYSNTGFLEKEFNDVDAAIFSLLTYLNFNGIASSDKERKKLGDCLTEMFEKQDAKIIAKSGFMKNDIVKMSKILINSFRFREVLMYGYVRILDDKEQLGAMTFILPTNEKIIAFEGTGPELVGWEEDFKLSYEFPGPAQQDAIKYLKKHTSIFDEKIIVLGHSKGGNLALVSAMYSNFIIKHKIKSIYSFDGPGLRENEINSRKYHSIEKKLIHLVPTYSIIGLLLRHSDSYRVVHSPRIDMFAHSLYTWQVDDDKFREGKLSRLSKNLDNSLIYWLEKHSDESREKIFTSIFNFLKDAGITDVMQLKQIKTILTLIKKSKDLDEETKAVLYDFIEFNFNYYKNNL